MYACIFESSFLKRIPIPCATRASALSFLIVAAVSQLPFFNDKKWEAKPNACLCVCSWASTIDYANCDCLCLKLAEFISIYAKNASKYIAAQSSQAESRRHQLSL